MIVSFSVANFRSFLEEETFSLVASNRVSGSHEGHAFPIPDSKEKVLKTAVLYGANGAGKSNLFKAFNYLKTIALKPRKKNSGTGRETFRFSAESSEPSSFDLQFIADNKLYRFGFKLDDQRIIEEWLVRVKGAREIPVYERITDENGKVTIEAKGKGRKLQALATVGGPQNQSFLATIQATLDVADFGKELTEVLVWFNSSLTLIAPDASFARLGHLLDSDSNFREFASEFLKSSSTGVDHLQVHRSEITEDELRSLLPKRIVSKVLDDVRDEEDGTVLLQLGEGNELLIERTDENHFYRIRIQAAHEHEAGNKVSLDLTEESDGTRRLLNLIPALHQLRTNSGVFFIDEIDRSMHPILVREFLDFFLKSCDGGQRQIIVTTHESNLLDLELLRRDEIWFAEKDANAVTHLYPLTDFKVRNDLEIRKHYLHGRFGAIPFLGNLDRLAATDKDMSE
ncbi:ATP-binding protein [Methylobacter tundripaludum]|nr:ATP-binding protein [Methylobacter tundripaludum]